MKYLSGSLMVQVVQVGKIKILDYAEMINVDEIIIRDSEFTGLHQTAGSNPCCVLHFYIEHWPPDAHWGKLSPRTAPAQLHAGLMNRKP